MTTAEVTLRDHEARIHELKGVVMDALVTAEHDLGYELATPKFQQHECVRGFPGSEGQSSHDPAHWSGFRSYMRGSEVEVLSGVITAAMASGGIVAILRYGSDVLKQWLAGRAQRSIEITVPEGASVTIRGSMSPKEIERALATAAHAADASKGARSRVSPDGVTTDVQSPEAG